MLFFPELLVVVFVDVWVLCKGLIGILKFLI